MPVNTKIQIVIIKSRAEVPETYSKTDTGDILNHILDEFNCNSKTVTLLNPQIRVEEGWHR